MFGRKKRAVHDEGLLILAGVVHDLHGPLAEASLCVDILKGAELATEARHTVQRLQSAIDRARMAIEVAEAIRSAESDANYVPRVAKPTNISNMVKSQIDMLSRRYTDRDIKVVLDCRTESSVIQLAPRWINAALGEILKNAYEYSFVGSTIAVKIEASADHLQLHFKNRGPVLTDKDLKHCFDFGWRAPYSRAVSPSGIGQGLWLARKFVRAHGGEVVLRSSAGVTVVTVSLPLRKS